MARTWVSQGFSVPITHAALCRLALFSQNSFFTRWGHGCWMLASHLYTFVTREEREHLLLPYSLISVRRVLRKYFDWLTCEPAAAVQDKMYRLSQLSQMPTPLINYPSVSHIHGGFGGCWDLAATRSVCVFHLGKIKFYTLSNLYS